MIAAGVVRLRRRLTASARQVRRFFTPLLDDVRRHRLIAFGVLAIWVVAFLRALVDPAPCVPLLFNWTPSLPYHVVWLSYGLAPPIARGDFIVFAFAGDAVQRYPGLRGQPFFKQVLGVPGDQVRTVERRVFVNNVVSGDAKAQTFDHVPLQPIGDLVIPLDCYYVRGTHPDSFDSRYRASGLVCIHQIIGKAIPLF